MQDTTSILNMARGAFAERVDYEMAKVIDNIRDPNTKATAPRTLTLTNTFTADDWRENVQVSTVVKTKLVPTVPVTTSLYINGDSKGGEQKIIELARQIPGQVDLMGGAQEAPAVLKIVK